MKLVSSRGHTSKPEMGTGLDQPSHSNLEDSSPLLTSLGSQRDKVEEVSGYWWSERRMRYPHTEPQRRPEG